MDDEELINYDEDENYRNAVDNLELVITAFAPYIPVDKLEVLTLNLNYLKIQLQYGEQRKLN